MPIGGRGMILKFSIGLMLFVNLLFSSQNISPSQFRVELVTACEVLGLSIEPKRKAQKIYVPVSTGGCVQNLGCLREISQKTLNDMNETKRIYMAWKYPVWCKVEVGKKRGWIRKQFLTNKPCGDKYMKH